MSTYDELAKKLAYEVASYPPNHIDMRDCLDALKELGDWINATVLPAIKEVSEGMKNSGWYINEKSNLAIDHTKKTAAYLKYWNNQEYLNGG